MKISIAELVRLQKTAKAVEDAVNEAKIGAAVSAKASSISNFFDSLLNTIDITIRV